jgi:hypothetical protein
MRLKDYQNGALDTLSAYLKILSDEHANRAKELADIENLPAVTRAKVFAMLVDPVAAAWDADAGISGATGRNKRPGLDAMLKAVNVREFDMVAAWSDDRLGRSLTDLLSILQALHDKGIGLFLHQQGLDTTTSAGKDVSHAWRVRQVREGHHSRTGECRPCSRSDERSEIRTAPGEAVGRGSNRGAQG